MQAIPIIIPHPFMNSHLMLLTDVTQLVEFRPL